MNPSSNNHRCAMTGCERPHTARGWCMMHYQRLSHADVLEEPRELQITWLQKADRARARGSSMSRRALIARERERYYASADAGTAPPPPPPPGPDYATLAANLRAAKSAIEAANLRYNAAKARLDEATKECHDAHARYTTALDAWCVAGCGDGTTTT